MAALPEPAELEVAVTEVLAEPVAALGLLTQGVVVEEAAILKRQTSTQ